MKALVFTDSKGLAALQLQDVPDLQPGPHQAVVQVHASALNHRDVWITRGLYPGIKTPVILGSDGAGVVLAVGKGIDPTWVGRPVIINPALDWGGDARVQQDAFRILGLPDNGTQAEQVLVPAANLAVKPTYLSFTQAAAIPLAGLTGYRALFTHGQLQAGQTVLLTGIGGGVASLMLPMALAAGATVLVTSGKQNKIDYAIRAGAAAGADYREADWDQKLLALAGKKGIDLVVDSAGGEGFDRLTSVVKPGGRIVFFGATAGNPPGLNLRKVFWKQITVQGTTMGTPADFDAMVRYFEKHRLIPIIDGPYPLVEYQKAYQRMIDGAQLGKIVMVHGDSGL